MVPTDTQSQVHETMHRDLLRAGANSVWTSCQGLPDLPITAFASVGGNLIAGSYSTLGSQVFIYISTDGGANWSLNAQFHVNNHLPGIGLYIATPVTFLVDSSRVFFGIGGGLTGYVYASTDNGATWIQEDTSFTENTNCFAEMKGSIYAGTNHGVFRSTDDGTSWTAINTGMSHQTVGLAIIGSVIFAATSGQGIYSSLDSGTTWNPVYSTDFTFTGLLSFGGKLFGGAFQFVDSPSTGGIFVSTDLGNTWGHSDAGMQEHGVNVLSSHGTKLFAGTDTSVFLSIDTGATWHRVSFGTPIDSLVVLSFTATDSYLFKGTLDGAWRCPLSDVTSVPLLQQTRPGDFFLAQNFPNPFNPTTRINYRIPTAGYVTLDVYDLLGRRVATVVSEPQQAGNHWARFDAVDLASGIYYYRLRLGSSTITKKLVLIK